jgi:hypothetical protein
VLVVPSGVYKWSINSFISPYPAYSHIPTRDNIIKYDNLKGRVYVGLNIILRKLLKRIFKEEAVIMCGLDSTGSSMVNELLFSA